MIELIYLVLLGSAIGATLGAYQCWDENKISDEIAHPVIEKLRKCYSPKDGVKILAKHQKYLIERDPTGSGALIKVWEFYKKRFGDVGQEYLKMK